MNQCAFWWGWPYRSKWHLILHQVATDYNRITTEMYKIYPAITGSAILGLATSISRSSQLDRDLGKKYIMTLF